MTKPINKKVFLKKLNSMLNDPDNEKYIKWDENTNAILIKNKETFSEKVLPKCFNHKNFSSFVRQLNSYGFSKKKGIKNRLIYENKNFYKNMTDKDLESIEAKKPQEKKNKSITKNNKVLEINRNFTLNSIEEEKENDNEIKIKLNSCLDDLKLLLDNQEKIFKDIEFLKNEQKKIKLKETEESQDNNNYLKNSIKIYNMNNVNDFGINDDINNMNIHNSIMSFIPEDNNINPNQIKNNNDNYYKNINNSNMTTSCIIQKVLKK